MTTFIVIAEMYDGSEKSFWIPAESSTKAANYVLENKDAVKVVEVYN